MNPLFINVTEYSKKKFNELLEFHKNKFGIKIIITTLIMTVFGLYIIIQNIIYKNWKILIYITILIIVFYIAKMIFNLRIKKNNNNRTKSRTNYEYTFYNLFFKIKLGKKRETCFYFKIYKVFEREDDFYLYLDKEHSLIISKEGFTLGTSEEFSKFIRRKCILKYKNETK